MFENISPLLGFAAGALTILSPCVLPLVPIVLGSAADKHRLGPLALSAGLVVSFTVTGLAVAALGTSLGFDGEMVRAVGAVLIIMVGLAMVLTGGQNLLARLMTPIAGWASDRQAQLARFGLMGQAGIGALLGLVWSPCVGPTLGAATVLASQGGSFGAAALVMLAFGLGIAAVLLVIALLARPVITRWRGRMMAAGSRGKYLLGGMLILVGIFILSGADRLAEGWIVLNLPDWLIDLTTRY